MLMPTWGLAEVNSCLILGPVKGRSQTLGNYADLLKVPGLRSFDSTTPGVWTPARFPLRHRVRAFVKTTGRAQHLHFNCQHCSTVILPTHYQRGMEKQQLSAG